MPDLDCKYDVNMIVSMEYVDDKTVEEYLHEEFIKHMN